jgi:glycosyltransferase involved in cell wall biosynthesis
MKVSVITRTKNRPLMLKRAKLSVLSQTYKDIEWVVVNDGGDASEVDSIVDKANLSFPVIVVHNPKSLGMEAASNRGIQQATGEAIVIHDDDDSWETKFLEKTMNHLISQPSSMGCITLSTEVNEVMTENEIIIKSKKDYNHFFHIYLIEILRANLFPPISFIFKKKVWEEVGGYDESLPVLGDWDFNIKFLLKYEIDVIPEFLANYHHRPKVGSGGYGNSIFSGLDMHKKYDAILRNKYLREDLSHGKLGVGLIMSQGRNTSEIELKYRGLLVLSQAAWKLLEQTGLRKLMKKIFLKQ